MSDNKYNEGRGQFNLDYEETVLLRSRNGLLRKVLGVIYDKVRWVLNSSTDKLNEREKDVLREVVQASKEGRKRQ